MIGIGKNKFKILFNLKKAAKKAAFLYKNLQSINYLFENK